MDKVTQSNAANAEESAAEEEELTAQAESLKEAVADLLRLVDGQEANQGQTAKPVAARLAHYATATPMVRAKATKRGNSAKVSTRAMKSVLALGGTRGRASGGIPLEGDFKDF